MNLAIRITKNDNVATVLQDLNSGQTVKLIEKFDLFHR